MSDIKRRILSIDGWRSFFSGRLYPAVICLLVFVGNVSGLDYYLNFLVTGFLFFSMLISDSIKPAIIVVCTYVYQISLVHGPNYPNYSDFFYTGWRLPVSVIVILVVISSFLIFFVKNKIYKRISQKKTPFLLSLAVFSVSLFMNGAFTEGWAAKNLIFALFNALAYFFFFILFYHGLPREESGEELAGYFAYLAMLIAFLLIGEVGCLFLTSDGIFIDGSINKVGVALGWGIWNLVGCSLSVLIPVLFLGVMKNRLPWLYFAAATLTYAAAVLTMSRNALVFATLGYAASIIISCFVGKHKRKFRIITALLIAAVILFALIFREKISSLLSDYFERGFSDNGRYNLWRAAIDNFLSAPIFGRGFYGFDVETAVFGPLPKMAHNTVFQLLSATGIVGLLSYLYYRVTTAAVFFKKPSVTKTMLGLSILVFLGGSLLDNFVFNIYPTFFYTAALAISARCFEEQSSKT